MAKGKKPKEDLSRALWQFLLYLDSATASFRPEDDTDYVAYLPRVWAYLDGCGIPLMCSPLHDRDVFEFDEDGHKAGQLKKPHFHVMAQFDGPVPYSQALEYFEVLGVKKLELVPSRRVFERYTCHLDSPTKAEYDVADIKTFGGYEVKFLGDRYEQGSIAAIHQIADEKGVVYYADLSRLIGRDYPELLSTLIRYTSHFNNICYSKERMIKRFKTDKGSYVKLTYEITRYKIEDGEE